MDLKKNSHTHRHTQQSTIAEESSSSLDLSVRISDYEIVLLNLMRRVIPTIFLLYHFETETMENELENVQVRRHSIILTVGLNRFFLHCYFYYYVLCYVEATHKAVLFFA